MGSVVTGQQNEGAPDDGEAAYSADDSDLFARIRAWHKRCRARRHKWVQEATDAFAYVAGHQWDAADQQILRDQDRPAVTFNRIAPFIDGVCGLEIGNRQEQRIIPRQLGAAGVSDLMTAAVKWVRDDCDAEDEESEAFRDCVICGEGWTQTRLDYQTDPDGVILIERVDPMAVWPDSASTAANYADARYVLYIKDVTRDAARELAPNADDADLDAGWARDESDDEREVPEATDDPFYRNDEAADLERTRDRVTLVEVEWWEPAITYRVADPQGGQPIKLTAEKFKALQARAKAADVPLKHVRDQGRKYRRALVGRVVLSETDGNERGGFSLKAITGKRDRNKQGWYGMVRAMRDPQMWANKWLSQILHIVNSNAKGGYFAEVDVFANPDEAMDTISDPQSVTLVNPNRMGGIQAKESPAFPTGLMEMTQLAISSIPGVTGVSPEMMGQADRDQPASLEMQRKQQGMVLLADFFNGLRRYRKQQGRLAVWMIQEFISDGRLIRIGGQDEAQYVPLMRDPGMIEYDVVVDDTPSSPNMKERTWAMLTQLFPVLAKMDLPPQAMVELFKYSPLPATLIGKISQMAQQAAAGQQGDPHAAALAQTEQAKAQLHGAQTAKVQAETQKIAAETQLALSKMQAEIESLKAGAIANMAKAGVTTVGARLDAASAAADSLLTAHQQVHDQAMDVAGLGLQQAQSDQQHALAQQQAGQAAQQQAHGQGMDQQQLALQQQAQQQAAQQAQQGSPAS